jgi:glucokinase
MWSDHPVTTILALDIGGTKMAAGLVDAAGTVLANDRVDTPPDGDAETLWASVVRVVDSVLASPDAVPYDAVGIGCGGPMHWPAGLVSPINIHGWRGFPLLHRMAERYAGARPIAIHNDAVALAVAEHRWGTGRGHDHVLGMVVSTGVGGGLVLGGVASTGARATPDTSGTWWSTQRDRRAPAAAAAASRRSPAARRSRRTPWSSVGPASRPASP